MGEGRRYSSEEQSRRASVNRKFRDLDVFGELQKLLPKLSPSEFTFLGMARRLGMAQATLQRRVGDIVDINPCFKHESSHRRWLSYNSDKLIAEGLKARTLKELEEIMHKKYGCRVSSDFYRDFLGEYKPTRREGRAIYLDKEMEDYDIALLSYFVGYWIGDGSYSGDCVALYSTERDHLDWLEDKFPCDSFKGYREPESFFAYKTGSENILRFFRDTLSVKQRKTYVEFPFVDWYKSCDIVELLAGMVDADGWIEKDSGFMVVETTSKPFYEGLREFVGNEGVERTPGRTKNCLLYTLRLSRRLSYEIDRRSKFLKKRRGSDEYINIWSKIRKKAEESRDSLRFDSPGYREFLCKWNFDT